MRRKEAVIFTNMCMVQDAQGRVVVQYHGGDWKGWCFPGGHVEYSESFTDSVIREIYEETGLTIEKPQLCGIKDWFHHENDDRYVVVLYKANRFSGELHSSDEGEVRWVTLEEMQALPLASGMKDTLQVFLNDSLSEQYFFIVNDQWITQFK